MHNISRICQPARSIDFYQNRLPVVLVAAMMMVVMVMMGTYSNDHLRLRRIW
jgi:hypothetical protein